MGVNLVVKVHCRRGSTSLLAKWQRIKALHAQGVSTRKIARTLGVSRNTVRKYLKETTLHNLKLGSMKNNWIGTVQKSRPCSIRGFTYVQEQLLHGLEVDSLNDFAAKLKEFQDEYNQKPHSKLGRPPKQMFQEEKAHLIALSSLEFIEKKENVIFLGPPGVGKTHLSVALGIKACMAKYRPMVICFLTETIHNPKMYMRTMDIRAIT